MLDPGTVLMVALVEGWLPDGAHRTALAVVLPLWYVCMRKTVA